MSKRMDLATFDAADYLATPEEVAAYLEAALAEGDDAYFLQALGDAARSAGMARVAERTGLGRESLYKALAPGKHPRWETVVKVLDALGLRVRVESRVA